MALFLKRLQVLDQIEYFLIGERQPKKCVVVVYYVCKSGKPSVVIKPALLMRPQPLQRRGSVRLIGRAPGLKIVNANLRSLVHIPARLGEERRHVTGRAAGLGGTTRHRICPAPSSATRCARLPLVGLLDFSVRKKNCNLIVGPDSV